MSILVGPDGKIFMSLDKQSDMAATLEAMGKEYGLSFTPQEIKKFSLCQTFGVPISHMKSFLALSTEQQDRTLKNQGIPCDSIDNQFKAWVRNARATNHDLRIAIKADQQTPYAVIKKSDELSSRPQGKQIQSDYLLKIGSGRIKKKKYG